MIKNWRSDLLDFAVIAGGLCLAYLPVFFFPYLHHDDVNFFLVSPTFSLYSFFDMNFSAGRFLGAGIFAGAQTITNSLKDIFVLRSVCVLCLILSATIVARQLQKHLSSRMDARILSVIVFTLPAFEILASYAGICFQILGVVLSAGAASCVLSIPAERSWPKVTVSLQVLAAVVLFVAAICIYQSTAMFFWACLAPVLLFSSDEQRLKKTIRYFFRVGFLGLAVYAVILFLARPYIELKSALGYNPFLLSHTIGQKVAWFFQEPFLSAVNLWKIYPERGVAVVLVGYVACSAMFFAYRWYQKRRQEGSLPWRMLALRIIVLVALFPLAFLPSLAWARDAAFYRCLTGLSFLIVCVLAWTVRQWVDVLPFHNKQKTVTVFLLVVFAFGIVSSFFNIYRYVVYPEHMLYQRVKNEFSKKNPDNYAQICFVKPQNELLRYRYDEFGFPVIAENRNDVGLIAAVAMEFLSWQYYPFHISLNREQSIVKFYLTRLSDGLPEYFEKRVISVAGEEPQNYPVPTLEVSFLDLYQQDGPLHYLTKKE